VDGRILDLIATMIACCERPRARGPGYPPAETVRVLATLRQFLREGHTVAQPASDGGQGERLDPALLAGRVDAPWPAPQGSCPCWWPCCAAVRT
jgi:hypothetical protein